MSFAKNYYGLIGLAIELGFVPVLVCYALVSLRQACVVSKFLDRKRLLVRFQIGWAQGPTMHQMLA